MSTDDRASSKSRQNREKGQVDSPDGSHPSSSTPKSSSRSSNGQSGLASGNSNPGRRDTPSGVKRVLMKPPPDGAKQREHPSTNTSKSSQSSGTRDSEDYDMVSKEEVGEQNPPTNDVNSSPVIDSVLPEKIPQRQEGRPGRSGSGLTRSATITGASSGRSGQPVQPNQPEDPTYNHPTTHTVVSVGPRITERGNGTIEMAQKTRDGVSYSQTAKAGVPAPEPPVNDNTSSRSTERELPVTQPDPTQARQLEESSAIQVQHMQAAEDDRRAQIAATQNPPSTRYISTIASGFTTFLGGRAPAVGEFSKEDIRRLQKDAKDGYKYRNQFETLRNDYNKLWGDYQKQGRYTQALQHENQRLKERLDSVEHELKNVTKRYEDVKSLSDTRGKELVGAQVFLSKADALSISDLTHMIQTLNQEIYQASASLSDAILRCNKMPEDTEQYVSHSKGLLGPLSETLREAAERAEEPVHPLLVQVTLQALLVNFCAKKIHLWTPQESNNQFLHTLYHEIRSSSDQAVSGRWRALTRAQLKPEIQTWLSELTRDLHAILMAASWEVKSSEDVDSFEAKLQAIFKAVLDVRSAIGEKVTSSDIEPNVVQPGSLFSKTLMEDEYPDDRPDGQPEMVIATIGMGLCNVAQSAHNDALLYTNILPPKIVLKSALEAAFQPPPPPSDKRKRNRRTDDKVKS